MAVDDYNQRIIEEFRASGGDLGGSRSGRPHLLLTHTGARSGAIRTNPLACLELDGHLYVFGSRGGDERDPDWAHNLRAHPGVTVEFGSQTYKATARELTGDERNRVFAEQARAYPIFGEYQAGTSRLIPVFELVR
jgi:deazaflavin-dependent oxidoreductase (nitroreductase family)